MSRSAVAAMTAYTLEPHAARIKLNQNESADDWPRELKEELFRSVIEERWNRYPDFESRALREALARAYDLRSENILTGNGSNELLAAAISTFVGPGTRVAICRPSFSLYEKLVTVAGGTIVPIPVDARTGLLPLDAMAGVPVVIVCSPNNPTGGVLPANGIQRLLESGSTVLFDRAYGDFAVDVIPPIHDRLVTFSTFSKAWGLAALRVGWLASTEATCREIRKVKLPYSLNIISEAAAAIALRHPEIRDANVARTIAERERVFTTMSEIDGIEPYPSAANFIAFNGPFGLFASLLDRGVLIREFKDFLRVSIGTREENDSFLNALKELS